MSQFNYENSDSTDCAPFRTKTVLINGQKVNRPIVPCGTIANSLFNDTFVLWLIQPNNSVANSIKQVPLQRTGIAWKIDYNRYKRNPPGKE